MRIARRLALLVALWLLAWGEITAANVISGVAVASALLVAFPPTRQADGGIRLRPVRAARLAAHVVAQLVTSNLVMARAVLRRRPTVRPGVLAHRLRRPSEEVVTIMASVIALSPGTMTVDVDRAATTIYVHFLMLTDVKAARASLARLEQLSARAIAQTGPESSAVETSPKEGP